MYLTPIKRQDFSVTSSASTLTNMPASSTTTLAYNSLSSSLTSDPNSTNDKYTCDILVLSKVIFSSYDGNTIYCGQKKESILLNLFGVNIDTSCKETIEALMPNDCAKYYDLSFPTTDLPTTASLSSYPITNITSSSYIATKTITQLITPTPAITSYYSLSANSTSSIPSSNYAINNSGINANLALATLGLFALKNLINKLI